jgi:hypothetical protein
MKKKFILILLVFISITGSRAQESKTDYHAGSLTRTKSDPSRHISNNLTESGDNQLNNLSKSTGIHISLSSGMTLPTGDYKNYSKAGMTDQDAGFPIDFLGFTDERTGKSQFNLDISYQFSSLGAGISIGKFTHEMTNLDYELNFPTKLKGGEIDGLYYGIGPDYNLSLGKFKMTTMLRAGMMQIDLANFTGSYNGSDTDIPVEIIQTTLSHKSKSNLVYSSFGVRFSYPFSNKLNIFTKADFFTSIGDGLPVDDNYYLPFDTNNNHVIDLEDVVLFTQRDYQKNESRFIKPQMLNLGVGLTYTFGSKLKDKKPLTNNNTFVQDNDPKQEKEETRKIVLDRPQKGSQFGEKRELKEFTWKVIGKPFNNPKYIIEVHQLKQNGHIYTSQTKNTSIDSKLIFKETTPSGQYAWSVTELRTGTSSDIKTFTYTDCDITMEINNVEVECLGYIESEIKYQICFDVSYLSPVGDLTYTNPGSGLNVFDQNYNSLGYNLTGTNTTLQTQIGSTQTTVHYCFETLVNSTVTSIGFGLQGDDLDPSPIICQPGASNGVDKLPSCLCDECDEINIDLSNFSITPNQQNASQFNFNGNLNVNTPIYGIEFQLISMNYTANPGTCSNGISSVETSGMFLQAGTTINNSNSIQFINESASQSPNSNDNASKNIVYQSSSALNGSVPINLNIGLPQPLPGLDSGCCQIDYEVCLKVKVFYEDGSCKTCFTTQCFNFNNQ